MNRYDQVPFRKSRWTITPDLAYEASGRPLAHAARAFLPGFADDLEPPLKPTPLRLKSNWHYEVTANRQHYVVEAWVGNERGGRAHGWFEPGARFVLEKIEMTRPHRSKGYGTFLIEELRAKARENGCTELVIQGVVATNRRAIRLYESLGATGTPASEELRAFVFSPP